MGEYARWDILDRFGVDIGGDDLPPRKPKPPLRVRCERCGKQFRTEQAMRQHGRDAHPVTPVDAEPARRGG